MKKIKFKKLKLKKLKKETMYMMFTVVCLSLTMISTSYSIFFDVKTNKNEQTITTGELTVQFTNSTISSGYVYPSADEDVNDLTSQSIFYLQNSGTIDGAYTFTVSENDNHELSLDYIKLALFEYNAATSESTMISDIIKLGDCITDENGNYIIYSSNISSSSSATYSVKFWLNEYSPEFIIGETIDLELNIESEVLEAVMLYDFSGTLSNSDGVLSNATISLNNGSITSTTSSSGAYTLNDVRSGTYNVTITLSDGSVIKDYLIVDEAASVSVSQTSDIYTIFGGLSTSVGINFTVDSDSITSVEAS